MRNALRSILSLDLILLLAVLVVVAGAFAFIKLADEVKEGSTQRFDDYAIRALRRPDNPALPIGPKWLAEVGRDLTALGGVAVLSLITLAVTAFLLIRRRFSSAIFLLSATAGGLALSSFLKYLVNRDRPNLVPHLSSVYTSSFPSGHSMLSAVVYLTLGALLARFVTDRPSKLYFLFVALTLTGFVGLSRIYMGVHYPTDVLAGWTAGLVWATLCWLTARYLQRRGTVEPPDPS